MEPQGRPERCFTRRRQALADATNWVNNQSSTPPPLHPFAPYSSQQSTEPFESSPPSIPHHGSLAPGGALQIRNNPSSPISKAEDKRISAISSEDARNSNRDSQISNTSTNASGKPGRRTKTRVGPWRLGRTIGKGASGRVRKGRHAVTQQDAAIKIVSKKSAEMLRSTSLAVLDTTMGNVGKRGIPFGIEREVVIMKLIEHPNIIKIYDVWENRGELYLVLEYVEGGELFDHITSNRVLPESEAIRIFRQMLAGLSYCHRFNICHRDLKPENILMDYNRNIKIVDFGMAALQPSNRWLKTACGSPHYAAPEVIRGEPYHGVKADIWSCGVILFAMLTGYLPFDGHDFNGNGDMQGVIEAVLAGDYIVPDRVSAEATDLIYRILQRDPQRRIPIKKMWQHPLIMKYENLDPTDEHGRAYIGPAPALTANDCGSPIRHRKDLDGEIMRNLQNLWYGITEDELAQRLLNDIPNHEKVMYTKLLKFRDETLEDYNPPMDYSVSDYHHNPPPDLAPALPKSSTRASLQPTRATRRVSQYSLVDSNMPPPRKKSQSQSVNRQPSIAETEGSYDPFNPSRARVGSGQADHARITVHRGLSHESNKNSSIRVISTNSIRKPTFSKTREEGDGYSIASTPPRALHSSGNSRLIVNRRISRGSSRVTLASRRSVTSTSSVIIKRPSSSYKRNVSFAHIRNRPTSGRHPRLRNQEHHDDLNLQQRYQKDHAQAQSQAKADSETQAQATTKKSRLPHPMILTRDTPELEELLLVRSRKAPGAGTGGSPIKKARTSLVFRDDARKVSLEMEKLCEEAFNRSSTSSRHTTPGTAIATNRGSQPSHRTFTSATTPETSFSVHEELPSGSIAHSAKAREVMLDYQQRPLPEPPSIERKMGTEHLGSYTQRELQKTKEMLIKRRDESMMAPGYLDDIIAHLDRLMQPSAIRLADEERRAVTTPNPDTGIERRDTFEEIIGKGNIGFRSASEPDKSHYVTTRGATIRLVDGSISRKSISPVKPLTIRKKSESSTPSSGSPRQITPKQSLVTTEQLYRSKDNGALLDDQELEPIDEDEDKENFDPVHRFEANQPKKRNWFRRHQGQKSSDNLTAPTPPPKETNPIAEWARPDNKRKSAAPSEGSANSDPLQPNKAGKSHKFFKIFSGKRDSRDSLRLGHNGDYDISEEASIVTQDSHHQQALMSGALRNQSTTTVSKHGMGKDSNTMAPPPVPRPIQPHHQNWLARFLRIKPAVSVMCFQVSKIRARKEVAALFRDWRRYGMKDVIVDKAAARVFASVDAKNSLGLPGLSLVGEFYTLLHRGKKANLAIARLTQEKGAKSSFVRVVVALEMAMRGRGLLVEDERVVREVRAGAGM